MGVPEAALVSGELKLAGRLDARFFALLEAIDATGSINKAAATAGYIYKGAWLVLETASNLAHAPLTERVVGGLGGGGTRLTPAAHELLAAWRHLASTHDAFLREADAWPMAQGALAGTLRRLRMKTSAPNQFAGTIARDARRRHAAGRRGRDDERHERRRQRTRPGGRATGDGGVQGIRGDARGAVGRTWGPA